MSLLRINAILSCWILVWLVIGFTRYVVCIELNGGWAMMGATFFEWYAAVGTDPEMPEMKWIIITHAMRTTLFTFLVVAPLLVIARLNSEIATYVLENPIR